MNTKKNEDIEVDLIHILQVLMRNAFIIILVAIIFAGVFFGVSKAFITPMYEASAFMYVNSSNLSLAGAKVSISASDLNAAKSLVETYSVILQTRMTLEEVIEQAELNYSYEQLQKMIMAASVNGTEIFSITVRSSDPGEAEKIANTIVQVLPDKIASVVDGSSVRIVDYAVRPAKKSSPNNVINAAKGAVLGVLLSAMLVIIADVMDEQVHDVEYLTKTYDLPILASIPDLLAKNEDFYYYKSSEKRSQK